MAKLKVLIYDTNNYARIKAEQSWDNSWIRSLCEEACQPDNCLRIYVFDGRYGNEYRKKFYPEYKATRKAPLIDTFFCNLEFFEELLQFAPQKTVSIRVNGFEADDIIADLCKRFENPTILTTDKDLLAIPNADLPMCNNEWEDREFIQSRKIFVGDTSDNIKGIAGFGEGAWKKLSTVTKTKIKEWIETLSDSLKNEIVELVKSECGTRASNALLNTSKEEVEVLKKIIQFRDDVPELYFKWGNGDSNKLEEKLKENLL